MTTVLAAAVLLSAADEFAAGVAARHDSVQARIHFAAAATGYDQEWSNVPSPECAANRGRAHFLAGHTAKAIQAFRQGLAIAPWNRRLQHDLEQVRDTIPYPASTPLRPPANRGLRSWYSPNLGFAVSSMMSLLLAVGLVARFTSRPPWWRVATALGAVGMLAVALIGVRIEFGDSEPETGIVVARDGIVLRTGNGNAFPARIDSPLPEGVEGRWLYERGGWVQVELGDGVIGWVPSAAVLFVGEAPPTAAGRTGIPAALGVAAESTR